MKSSNIFFYNVQGIDASYESNFVEGVEGI